MAFDNIRRAVLEAAQAEAERIRSEARETAASRRAEVEASLRAEAERKFQQAARAIDETLSREQVRRRGQHHKVLLAERNAALRNVFERAREIIVNLHPEEASPRFARQLDEASAGQTGVVRAHRDDFPAISRAIEQVNSSRSPEARLTLAEDAPLQERGGFIYSGASFEVDRTLSTVLADLERQLAPDIATALFATSGGE